MASRDALPNEKSALLSGLVYLSFIVVGCAYIVFSKMQGLPIFLVTLVPIAIMLVYAGLSLFARFIRMRDDQTGDNLYYMGFLFTLTSLGVALFNFTSDGGADTIVKNFGIAITSTIAGIALRVFFSQMRRDPVEVERASRLELSQASRKVRAELDTIVIEMNHFRRSAQQSAQQGFDEIASILVAGLKDYASEAKAPIELASENSGRAIERLSRTISDSLGATVQRMTDQGERLASACREVCATLEGFAERVRETQTPDQIMEIKLQPVVDHMRHVVSEMERRDEAFAKQVLDILSVLQRVSAAQGSTQEAHELLLRRQAELLSQQQQSFSAIVGAVAAVERAAATMEQAAATMTSTSNALQALGNSIEQRLPLTPAQAPYEAGE